MSPLRSVRTRLEAAEAEVREVCSEDLQTPELLAGLREPLSAAVAAAGMFLGATDPETTVFGTAAIIDRLPAEMGQPWMHHEFLTDDYNKFAELHRLGSGAVTLDRATRGRPVLSARHREVNDPNGYGPELRATFSSNGRCWGVVNLLRERGAPDYTEEELGWVDRVVRPVAQALCRSLAGAGSIDAVDPAPGVITLDPEGRVLSMSEHAAPLLADLDAAAGEIPTGRAGLSVPCAAYMLATVVRAKASGRADQHVPATRVRGRSGRWLTLRGDYTLSASGEVADVVVVVEPSRPSEILPIIVAAHGLSRREQEVLAELTESRSSPEIATRLFISEHTVRDHVRSILAKTGCASRAELLGMLFHHRALPTTG